VDIFDPSQPPDKGVSAAEIARQQRIAEGRVGEPGQRGNLETGEKSPTPVKEMAEKSVFGQPQGVAPKPGETAPSAPTPEAKPATAAPTKADISAAEQSETPSRHSMAPRDP